MHKLLILSTLFVIIFVFLNGCGDDKKEIKTDKNDSANNLIIKDSVSGKDIVTLKYIVKKGDKFYYKMVAKTTNSENSPATDNKEIQQNNEINYFYSKEVTDIDQNGIISFKVNFDSITISSSMEDQSIKYNSNVDDSVKKDPAFVQYNAVINNPFYTRVKPTGEITEVYGLENIYEKLFKALGDTLTQKEKAEIKQSFGEESIKEILQQEYQICPADGIPVDSSWVKSFNTSVLFFDVVNNAKYTLKSVEDSNGEKIANIEASLLVEFKTKEVKERGMTVKVENAETSGSGKIAFNLSRGCIKSKETTTNLKLELKLSAQGQSAKSVQGVTTSLSLTLLN